MNKSGLEEARRRLAAEEVVIFPTETFFGLAANPRSESAVAKLSALKSRPPGEGIPLIADCIESVSKLWPIFSPEAENILRRLVERFWPGPLTLVFPPASGPGEFAAGVCGPNGTIAVRVSSHSEARALAQAAGGLITATSANPRGEPPPKAAAAAAAYFPALFVLAGEAGGSELPSTLLDVSALPFRVLREGAVDETQLLSVIGHGPYLIS